MNADYVVVGAGSAGCVMASRLSETGASVILLEAGPSDWHPMIHIPAGMRSLLRNPLVNWNYTTEPEQTSGERRIEWPRGRTCAISPRASASIACCAKRAKTCPEPLKREFCTTRRQGVAADVSRRTLPRPQVSADFRRRLRSLK